MDQWFAKFLDGSLGNRTDKPDSLPESVSVSGMSVQCSRGTEENSPMQPHAIEPGDRVYWQRGDLTWQTAQVDFLHIDGDGNQWIFSTLPNGDQNTLNVKVVHICHEKERR